MNFPRSQSMSTHPYPHPARLLDAAERMRAFMEPYYRLNRVPVCADTDVLVAALQRRLDGTVVEAGAGSTCLTWRMPDRWEVRVGQLRRLDGTVLADFRDHPLLLWAHAIPFKGRVTREELLAQHVQTDPSRPDEFIYRYRSIYVAGARDWGFSLPYRLVAGLTDEEYEVEIDTTLDQQGTLKVVDAFLPGDRPETIVFAAHTCHPGQVSDGLGNIAVACEVFDELRSRARRTYSYRFLFGPEYFGAAAWLENAPAADVAAVAGGYYLDMLTTHQPLGMQRSLLGGTPLDNVARNVLRSHIPMTFERPFGELWGNDEIFYNGAGIGKPMPGIGRAMHREYHFNTDDMRHFSPSASAEALWALLRMVEVFETDYAPRLNYRGPLYFGGAGIAMSDLPSGLKRRELEELQLRADGSRSCFQLADALGVDYFEVRKFFDAICAVGKAEHIAGNLLATG